MLKLYFNTSFEGKEVLVGFEVGSAKKKKKCLQRGSGEKILGGGAEGMEEGRQKVAFKFLQWRHL